MSEEKIGCLSAPCTTCPYRKDVPSGIWDESEYRKLPAYDRETFAQPPALFMCHQQTGGLCTGWLQSHADHRFDLLALRFARNLDNEAVAKVAQSEPEVPLFRTGEAAMKHGMKGIKRPSKAAKEAMKRVVRNRERSGQ